MPKKSIFLISIFFAFSLIFAVSGKAQGNLPFADDKPVHFGFSLGVNFMDFAVIPTSYENDLNVSSIVPGFSVGAISDFRLSKNLNFRFTPTLMLNQRILNYTDESSADLLSVPLFLPFYLKYSSIRTGNFRPYLIGGAGVWMDWGRNKERTVLLKPFDLLLEAGIGTNIYFSFFKLAPELKFAFGFNNMLTPLDERDAGALLNPQTLQHTESINKLTTRMITLTFHFE